MNLRHKLCQLLCAIVLILFSGTQVLAQETDFNTLQVEYRKQLLSYQAQEREFSIAKEDYEQLQTLASLERAVAATQAVMSQRVEVLQTYLNLVQISLEQTYGIEESQKQASLEKIAATQVSLTQHSEKVAAITDRFMIRQVVTEFKPLAIEVENTTYQALTLISVGKLQTVVGELSPLLQDLEVLQQQSSSSALTVQDIQEIRLVLEQSQTGINAANIVIQNPKTQTPREINTQINRQLNQVMVYLRQAVAFFDEVI